MAADPIHHPLLRSYLAEMRGTLAPTTLQAYRHVLNRLDHLPLTLDEARAWKSRRMDEVQASTVATELRALKSFDEWHAEEMDIAPVLSKLTAPKVSEGTHAPVVTEEEFRRLIEVCGADRMGRRDAAMLWMMWSTGARLSELGRLTVQDLDLDQSTVRFTHTKNRTARSARIIPDARRALRRYLKAWDIVDGPLWLGERGVGGPAMIAAVLERRSKEADVWVTSHQFRRALADRWLKAGGSEVSLMEVAGWRSVTMISKYVRAVRGDLALHEAERVLG